MGKPVFTIGHSNHSIDHFLQPLVEYHIQLLIDVRSYPRSKRHPHFSKDELIIHLSKLGIDYQWSGTHLGGMRKLETPNLHNAITAAGGKAFAAHMSTSVFKREMDNVFKTSQHRNCCLMCAEADPYSCHRQFIADYATIAGYQVKHLKYESNTMDHKLSESINIENGHLVYNKNSQQELF